MDGSSSGLSKERAASSSWARSGRLTQTFFISDIWNRLIYIIITIGVLFWLTRSLALPPVAEAIASWSLPKLAAVWPAFTAQHEVIRQQLGDAQASWFVLYVVCVFASLVVGVRRLLYELPRRWTDLMPFQASDVLMPVILVFCLIYVLFADSGGKGQLGYDFVPDRWGLFYLRQVIAFGVISWVAMAAVLYVVRGLMQLATPRH